jgi:fluoride exporter
MFAMNYFMNYFVVALGGSLGAVARYQVSLLSQVYFPSSFPLSTLFVNVVGSFLFGLAFYLIVEKMMLSESARLFILVGFLGAFTTFSTFSFELLELLQKGQFLFAFASASANLVLSFLALCLAYYAAKQLI